MADLHGTDGRCPPPLPPLPKGGSYEVLRACVGRSVDRREIVVSGIVQGVGFRPFVYGLAGQFHLSGFIKNRSGEVFIEVEGEAADLDRFLHVLRTAPPPLARIDSVTWSTLQPRGDASFHIQASGADTERPIFLSPDVATCADCLAELFDPSDRRYRYPFLNCTNCGPRLTIITGSPYDRERTTMATFAMCPACRAEYDDPNDRRFHAQPTACPVCGPRLEIREPGGRAVATADPIAYAASALRRGQIGALKSLGGYHLTCAAADDRAVGELRRRKQRDEKPFAIMVADMEVVRALCWVSDDEAALLESIRRPIVLLRRRHGSCLCEGIAPRNPRVGVMLPYTPLHHLLLHKLEGVPLVMTSGNLSDEPIAFEDGDALTRLSGIADFFVDHNRTIHLRCDDSVVQVVAGVELPVRRARGYAPEPLTMPVECRVPVLALGGQLKSTFALGRGRHAFLSQHLGDLDHYEALRAYEEAIVHFERLFQLRPEVLVHDLHPDYASTRYAREHAGDRPRLAVQHHHAHLASGMAEHGLNEPLIGVIFDGTGYGTDGTIWGGEFLVGDYLGFRRAAHFRPVAMPGGERAIREPWRMAVSYLADAGEDRSFLSEQASPQALATIERMLERRINAPWTSSAGRLFDAVAAIAGVRGVVSFEGQAAMELEGLAAEWAGEGSYPFEIVEGDALQIDVRPMIRALAADRRRGIGPGVLARRFHRMLVEIIAQICACLRARTGLDGVVLSGGVFLNGLLTAEVGERLTADGFRVYRQRRVPPNDGGLSLGQLAVAAARGWHEGVADVSGNTGEGG